MNAALINVAKKLGGLAVTVGLPMVCNYFENKALDAKIKKTVTEVLAETSKKN